MKISKSPTNSPNLPPSPARPPAPLRSSLALHPWSYLGPGLRWGLHGALRSEGGADHSPGTSARDLQKTGLSGRGRPSPRASKGEGDAQGVIRQQSRASPPSSAATDQLTRASCALLARAAGITTRGLPCAPAEGAPAEAPLGCSPLAPRPLPSHSLLSRISAPARAARPLPSSFSPSSPLAPPPLASPFPSSRPTLSPPPPRLPRRPLPPRSLPLAGPGAAWAGHVCPRGAAARAPTGSRLRAFPPRPRSWAQSPQISASP